MRTKHPARKNRWIDTAFIEDEAVMGSVFKEGIGDFTVNSS